MQLAKLQLFISYAQFPECHGRGSRHVEGIDSIRHRYLRGVVGIFNHVESESVPFRAEYQCETRLRSKGGIVDTYRFIGENLRRLS